MPAAQPHFTVKPEQYDDLKAVFTHVFNSFATDPVEIADNVDGIKSSRHSRELLGVLQQVGLVGEYDVNGEGLVWQVTNPGTYDTHTLADAIVTFDATFSQAPANEATVTTHPAPKENGKMSATTTEKPARTKPDTNPADLPLCRCGCGSPVGRKSFFKPGHDARMAGNVARDIAAGGDREALLDTLPSDALRRKSAEMADRLLSKKSADREKADAKIERQAADRRSGEDRRADEVVVGTVKVGRKKYDAVLEGNTVTYTKDGEDIEADDKVKATFAPTEV